MKRNIISYNSNLKAYANRLRKHMTLAEVLLWNELKQKKMNGYDFDRQRPIGDYIVDFYCKDLQLVIEIDGRSHNFKEDKDKERQELLENLGVHFLRFWDDEIKHDRISVVERIKKWICEHSLPPTPTHPRRGIRKEPAS